MNGVSYNNTTAIYEACFNNSVEIVKLLMKNKANPNIIPNNTYTQTTLMAATFNGNLELVKILLNLDKSYEISFDWNKLINHGRKNDGFTIVHYCCEYGYLDILKYLVSIENKFKTKLDWHKLELRFGKNPLLILLFIY